MRFKMLLMPMAAILLPSAIEYAFKRPPADPSDIDESKLASVAFLVKTCKPFHETRLQALLTAWGDHPNAMRVIATDAPIASENLLENETVIRRDFDRRTQQPDGEPAADPSHTFVGWENEVVHVQEREVAREEAHLPLWRDFRASQKISALKEAKEPTKWRSAADKKRDRELATNQPLAPALTRRVASGLEALYDQFHAQADWFLIVDDDTFVRWAPLRAYLHTLDASKPMMVGAPVPSSRFLTREAIAARGTSTHCGGCAWAISKAALKRLRPKLEWCLNSRDVVRGGD